MERRIREEQKRAASSSMQLRSQPIDATTTPRQAPAQRRHHSFSSPASSHTASPAYSDHSTTRGFYSPRGGLDDDDDDDEDGEEVQSDDESELHEIEEREGDFSRPVPVLEPAPVTTTTTVSRSVRVEPKMVTRVDSGAKEEKTRVVEGEEDGEVEVRSLSRRRSDERKRPIPKTAAFEMKENEEDDEVELGEVRASVKRRSEEWKRLNLEPKTAAFDSTNERDEEKEEAVVEVRKARRSEGRNENNTIVFDTAPLQPKEEQFVAARTVVFEPPVQKEEFVEAEDGGESGRGGVKQQQQQQQQKSARRKQEGRRGEVVSMKKTALWLRVLGLAMCLISFSIMAADKNKGWALDSFDRYKEFRSAPSSSNVFLVE